MHMHTHAHARTCTRARTRTHTHIYILLMNTYFELLTKMWSDLRYKCNYASFVRARMWTF